LVEYEADRHWYLLPQSHSLLVPSFHRIRSPLLKTGFFRQVRELKIQMKKFQAVLYLIKESPK
jgi:hypothetical protein